MRTDKKNKAAIKDAKQAPQLAQNQEDDFPIAKQNYLMIAAGFGIIVLGFILMAGGKTEDPNVFNPDELFSFRRITLAPITVLIGFVFVIWAIMRKPKETAN